MPHRSLKSFIPFASLLLVIATSAFSQQPVAVVEQARGIVEIRLPGGEWQTVEAGDAVSLEATVSTGFGAEACLALGENTVVRVEPLTRVTINELAVSEGVVAFVSAIGREHSVSAGEQNFNYDTADQPDAPAAVRVSRRSVSHMTTMR